MNRVRVTASEVERRMAEAGRVLLLLPHAGCFPMGWRSMWPADWSPPHQVADIPSPAEISAMDEAYRWAAFVTEVDERRLVLMRSLVRRGADGRLRQVWTWRKLRKLTGLHHDTLTKVWGRGIDRIVRRLNGEERGREISFRQFASVVPARVDPWAAQMTRRAGPASGARP